MAISRTFTCDAQGLTELLDEAGKLGVEVSGDPNSGQLVGDTPLGRFEGTYEYDGTRVTFCITRKPSLIPDALVESQLDEMARRRGLA